MAGHTIRRQALWTMLLVAASAYLSALPAEAQQENRLTGERAIGELRAKAGSDPHAAFRILKEITPTLESIETGKAAEAEKLPKDTELYGEGVLISLLRFGGFLILEYDSETEKATRLHLVSRNDDGRVFINSEEVGGSRDEQESQEIVSLTEKVAKDLMSLPMRDASPLLERQIQDDYPQYEGADDDLYFPRGTEQYASKDQIHRLKALYLRMVIQLVRWSPSRKVYAASPYSALGQAATEMNEARDQFRQGERAPSGPAEDERESVKSPEEVTARIDLLERLDNFLEQARLNRQDKPTYDSNLTISTFPVRIESVRPGEWAAVTSSGLVVLWQRLPEGRFELAGISIAIY